MTRRLPLLLLCLVVVGGCSWWVHEIEDPVLSGSRWAWDQPTTRGSE